MAHPFFDSVRDEIMGRAAEEETARLEEFKKDRAGLKCSMIGAVDASTASPSEHVASSTSQQQTTADGSADGTQQQQSTTAPKTT